MVTRKAAAARAGRLPVSRAVLWTGITGGVFLAAEALLHRLVLPLSLPAFADAAMTVVLILAAAVVVAELTRRHHRAVAGHAARYGMRAIGYGGRLSAAGGRRACRHGRAALAWLAARAGPRWETREHRPLVFRRLRGEPGSTPAEEAPACADRATYSWGSADSPYGWPAGDLDSATSRARHASTGGKPYVVTEYPPGGGPGRTVATYLHGKPSSPAEGSTTMPASKISTGHRAQRAARTGAPGIPSEWAAVVGQTADFEPESDAELLGWMARQVTGLSAWAEALVDTYEHCTAVIGIDPAAAAMLHDVADAAAQAAETMSGAKARFTQHYELPREFAASGGLMTHDGRWITGDGA